MNYIKRKEKEKQIADLTINQIFLTQKIQELYETIERYKRYVTELEQNYKIYKHQYTKLNKKWQKIKEMQIYFRNQDGEEE